MSTKTFNDPDDNAALWSTLPDSFHPEAHLVGLRLQSLLGLEPTLLWNRLIIEYGKIGGVSKMPIVAHRRGRERDANNLGMPVAYERHRFRTAELSAQTVLVSNSALTCRLSRQKK